MTDQNVEVESGDITLSGSLRCAADAKGVVIFVHGSGPMDRNENVKRQKLNIFNVLADDLEDAGFSSIRYDKRGCGASSGDFHNLRVIDLVDDLRAWIGYAQEKSMGPVYLCGHSEGTLIALLAAEGRDIAGLVLVCPFITPMAEILRWQADGLETMIANMKGVQGAIARTATKLLGGPRRQQDKLIKRIFASDHASIRVALRRVNAGWLRDLMEVDPADHYKDNTRPTLVLAAELDAQCPPEDGAKIAAMNPNSKLIVIDGLSHLLRDAKEPGFADYARQLREPMDKRVGAAITQWLSAVRS
jgi:pimeloyl-ACP methyl ester carboxylesterase